MTTIQDTDRFLAERLMGWHDSVEKSFGGLDTHVFGVWRDKDDNVVMSYGSWIPSASVEQALGDGGPQTVVGKMREKGWWLSLYESPANEYGWYAEFRSGKKIVQAFAITPAAAVSSASRKALEGEG